ncbi:hypothetical protein PVAG01_01445 [Phlyctema vagabunda]|uniref:Uncharacterized protein n=1 Tax=Phlyctema vagabunda TaxID=108571 RepID=A0ABR4PX72_9HELO
MLPLFLLPLAISFGPMITMIIVPDAIWYHKMRNSCDGFQTRVDMDSYTMPIHGHEDESEDPQYPRKGGVRFSIHSVGNDTENDLIFHLGQKMTPIPGTTQPFQFYKRFSSSSSSEMGRNIAIDVDTTNRSWRLLNLSSSDNANQWMALGSYLPWGKLWPEPPMFEHIQETLVMNGSYTEPTEKSPHVRIPEVNLQMAYMYQFLEYCTNEPFLRVFNTAGKSEAEIAQQVVERWSNEADDDVVMRTASFGHGRGKLTTCIKEKGDIGDSIFRVSDDRFVALAIISALRKTQVDLGLGKLC